MHRQMLLLEAVLTILDQERQKCTVEDATFTMDPKEDADDITSELLQLDQIFTRLLIKSNARKNTTASVTTTSSSTTTTIRVPFQWEAEPGKPKLQPTALVPIDEPLCPPPVRRSGSTGSSNLSLSSRRRSFSGVLKTLIHRKLPSSETFKFPPSFSPSSSTKSSRIHHNDEPCVDELKYQLNSPKAVFDGPGSCSSECTTSNVTPCNNLPFPASFVVPTHTRSFSSQSLSNALKDSPQTDAVSPLSFDTRGPCEIDQPGRYSYGYEATAGMDEYCTSPEWNNSLHLPETRPPVRSKSSSNTATARPFNREILFPSKSLSKFYKFNSINKVRSSTSSSEFSIELNGRLSSGRNLTSSRYLELDFKEAWNANREVTIYNVTNVNNVHKLNSERGYDVKLNNEQGYDVKSDIRSRVEEVVRNTDESKFTFSPVASTFLFSKSQSRDQSIETFTPNTDSDYIEIQPGEETEGHSSSGNGKNASGNGKNAEDKHRTSWFSRLICCAA